MMERLMALSFIQPTTLSLSKLSHLQGLASNNDNNGKCKLDEEAESLIARKRPRLSDDDGDNDSSNSLEEETEEEVSSEETSMNQLDTSEDKLFAKCTHFCGSNDGDTTSPSFEPRTPESRRRSDEGSSDDDDDIWM
jgi:hypothetical protein